MPLEYLTFDPSAFDFPKPRVSPLPDGLACLSLKAHASSVRPTDGNCRHFTRGRYALHEAYRLAGIGPGRALLAPAYHCRTMFDPALALGGEVLLYPLQQDLSADPARLDDLLADSPVPAKVLLATHFFGIPQQLEGLAAWCSARDITLVEDCSHVLLSEYHQPAGTGVFGDFVVSSPYKFVPSPDGGLLFSRQRDRLAQTRTRPQPFAAELRGVGGAFAKLRQRRRNARTCNTADIAGKLATVAATGVPQSVNGPQRAGCSADYRPAEEGLASLRFSRLVCRHSDPRAVARRRRENYRRWSEALVDIPHCQALFPQLPEDCVPYMFPLRIEHPDPHFCWLKRLGMPIWRWDSMALSACSTALDYRLHLLHLPCHQSLSKAELDWMIAAVSETMRHAVGRTA